MQAARSQAHHRVARFDSLAVEQARFFHHANDGPAQIVLALAVKARHLSGFAADERAMIFRAGPGKPADQLA